MPTPMRQSGWFERRLLVALILFSLVPTLLLVGVGTAILGEAVSLQTTPAGWERLGATGRVLLDLAEQADEPELAAAAARHREELTSSIQQAQRWGYLNRRVLRVLPWAAVAFVGILTFLGVRSARRTARELSSPIQELAGWATAIGRGDPLPPDAPHRVSAAGEFAVLRDSFRTMARELEESRARELEAERVRAAVGLGRAVAHELKNALTPLRLAVRTLQRSATGRSQDDGEAIMVIESESQRLEELARAFAQLGRPPEGPASDVDIVELLDHLARTHLPERIGYRLNSHEGPLQVHGHYEALSRVFANLLLNAVEAIGPDEAGTIQVEVVRLAGGEVRISITDSGPGLPKGIEDRIWDPDFTTKGRGTGLGLALVRQTVFAHGGSVSAGAAPHGGAEFSVILPTATLRPHEADAVQVR